MKVFFTCNWQSAESLLIKLKKITPQNEGKWKNIEGTNDISNCDYLVVFDDLDKNLVELGLNKFNEYFQDYNKIIYFQIENSQILRKYKHSWFCYSILPKLQNIFSYENNYFYIFTTPDFVNKSYDELINMKYTERNKNISAIVSSKNFGKTYIDRMKFLINYSKENKDKIDIYGKGWNNDILGSNYKGELDSFHQDYRVINKKTKYDGLVNYNYSLCLENYPNDKLISEKITDALLCWTLPIYSGSKYTNSYFPKDSFYLIDIYDKDVNKKIYNKIQTPPTKKEIDSIGEARKLILNKYNVWEQTYQVINNREEYLKEYKF